MRICLSAVCQVLGETRAMRGMVNSVKGTEYRHWLGSGYRENNFGDGLLIGVRYARHCQTNV